MIHSLEFSETTKNFSLICWMWNDELLGNSYKGYENMIVSLIFKQYDLLVVSQLK